MKIIMKLFGKNNGIFILQMKLQFLYIIKQKNITKQDFRNVKTRKKNKTFKKRLHMKKYPETTKYLQAIWLGGPFRIL